jgi:hypothetical protein
MTKTVEEANKALVLEAFNTLFKQRDHNAAERFLIAELYPIQCPQEREGLR